MKRFTRFVALLLTLLVAVMSLASCSIAERVSDFLDSLLIEHYESNDRSLAVDIELDLLPSELGGFYYRQLTDSQKRIYGSLTEALSRGRLSCVLSGYSPDSFQSDVNRAVDAIYCDHPEIFWIEGSWQYQSSTRSDGEVIGFVTLDSCDFWSDQASADRTMSELEAALSEVIALAEGCATDYERIKLVHDLIAENTEYDIEEMNSRNAENNSVYSCLVEGEAVCGGYARALQLILCRLDIPCISIMGRTDGEMHMWNCVYIDGEPYFIDPTWADDGEIVIYEWFCVSSEQMQDTHEPLADFSVPESAGGEYDYYRYHGYLLDSYDRRRFDAIIASQREEKIAYVKFSNAAAYRDAFYDLIINGNLENLSSISGRYDIVYIAEEEMLLFGIYN